MRRMFFRVVAVLSLPLFCYSTHAQTPADPAFSFSAPRKITTGAASQAGYAMAAAAVDINGDGNTDLYAQVINATGEGSENVFLMGNGTGGFALNTKSNTNDPNNVSPFFGVGFSPAAIFVDFNRDTYPDTLYVKPGNLDAAGCGTQQDGSISVFLGDGKGNFTADGYKVDINPIDGISVATGDFNNDGLQDVALLTYMIGTGPPCFDGDYANLRILLNNGDGTFTVRDVSMNSINISVESSHLVTGDFNGDGKLDVAFVGKVNSSQVFNVIQVLYGNADGTFKVGPTYTSDSTVDDMLAADLNGDGKTDLVILTEPKSPSTQYRIATLLAKQGGGFYWASEQMSSNPVTLVGLMDLNNDGKPDLAYYTNNPSTKGTSLRAFPGLGGGKFGASQLLRNLAPNEDDIIAPLKTGGPLDLFYALSYPPNKDVFLYEMLNQSK